MKIAKSEVVKTEVAIEANEHNDKTLKPRRRKKDFSNKGPLGGVRPDAIPGYHIRWILVDHPDKPNRFAEVCHNNDYEPVKPAEIGERDINGELIEGDTVTRANKGHGKMMLVKIPLEFYEQDLKEKTKRNKTSVAASTTAKNVDGTTLDSGELAIS